MKKLEKVLSEFSVTTKAGQDILEKQEDLIDVINQWAEEMSEDGRKLTLKAISGIEKATADLYKYLETNKILPGHP